ncbi:hypothetical protein PFICI_04816 [Pestalotiopsis fici W106-1]|uniref:F-box domain-containing protein n=1 Tax=Pestalotiopsis fici (strain W106-1 / CGMCC3.15140) TaxID=1229662 RepID=W3XA54_PESFW|nr:uncharacterized protein PFICI_04816 [Pestalotiopsis fici W106-1]ETS82940.1 hypothetical protein PFICI_04816 [Pestalotiopsis fici W106-1]
MSPPTPGRDWESLPVEISLSILKELSDLTALHNYLEASPAAARVFDTYGAEIVEANLASGAVHRYTGPLIRMSAYIRAGVDLPGVSNLKDFQHMGNSETTEHTYKPPHWTRPPLRLDASIVPASVLRGVLVSHYRLERLMVGCLSTYLARFRNMPPPMHVADEDFVWESEFRGPNKTEFVGAWEQQPAAVPVVKRDEGPPKWCEEQRVLRASWRLQVHEDLKAAAAAGELNWPDSDVCGVQRFETIYLLNPTCAGWFNKNSGTTDWLRQLICLEDELVYTVMDYVEDMEGVANITAAAALDTLPKTRDYPAPVSCRQHVLEVESYWSEMMTVLEVVHNPDDSHHAYGEVSPLQRVPWDFYRRRGFAFWCEARMQGYGLIDTWPRFAPVTTLPEVKCAPFEWNSLFLAWRSVLTEGELAEANRINEKGQAEELLPTPRMTDRYCSVLRNITPDVFRAPHVDT